MYIYMLGDHFYFYSYDS